MTNTPQTFMNGFRFFMLGLDFPPRTAIGYLWIVTEDTPGKENIHANNFIISLPCVQSKSCGLPLESS